MTSIALGAHFEDFIRKQVEGGRYNNASEVVRDALRLLEDAEVVRAHRLRELEALVAEGIADADAGRLVPAEQAFAEVRTALGLPARLRP